MSKEIMSVEFKMPDDPAEVERLVNLLSKPMRGAMILMPLDDDLNLEMLLALEEMVDSFAHSEVYGYQSDALSKARSTISKARTK